MTKKFLEDAFKYLQHLRPGRWRFSLQDKIFDFDQYYHLSEIKALMKKHKSLRAALGNYFVGPDIIVSRRPVSDVEINETNVFVDSDALPKYTPLRANNNPTLILHASISCKWTLRSDRAQNSRTEGLNLIRNRKGNTPHIVVVTAEPHPTRIASLALGTGDIDCTYYFALSELIKAVNDTGDHGAIDTLEMMTEGRRLRDIADLPFDLAI